MRYIAGVDSQMVLDGAEGSGRGGGDRGGSAHVASVVWGGAFRGGGYRRCGGGGVSSFWWGSLGNAFLDHLGIVHLLLGQNFPGYWHFLSRGVCARLPMSGVGVDGVLGGRRAWVVLGPGGWLGIVGLLILAFPFKPPWIYYSRGGGGGGGGGVSENIS